MDEESVLFQKRLEELAHKSYTNSQYLFTGFCLWQSRMFTIE